MKVRTASLLVVLLIGGCGGDRSAVPKATLDGPTGLACLLLRHEVESDVVASLAQTPRSSVASVVDMTFRQVAPISVAAQTAGLIVVTESLESAEGVAGDLAPHHRTELLSPSDVEDELRALYGEDSRLYRSLDASGIEYQVRIYAAQDDIDLDERLSSLAGVTDIIDPAAIRVEVDELAASTGSAFADVYRPYMLRLAAIDTERQEDAERLAHGVIASAADVEALRPNADAVLDFADSNC
jgi:hypothetical protein